MISLRHYQEASILATFDWWGAREGNPLIVLPTGTGKSIVVGELCRRSHEWDPEVRVLMLTHVQELVAQNFAELIGLWPEAPAGVYSAGLGKRQIRQITFASIQSVYKKAEAFQRIDIVIVDEAHLIPRGGDGMYLKLLNDLWVINPNIRIVGLTATPYRLDSGRLDDGTDAIFGGVAYELGIRQAIAEGFLSPLVTKATHTRLDVSGVGKRGGEFIPGQLEKAVDVSEINDAIVREVVAAGQDRRSWLFFCSGVNHAQHICDLVREHGYSCETIHAETPKELRRAIIEDFKAGKIRALASMNVLTTGFNAPSVDLIAMLRPTQSLGLYVQMVGRGTRLFAGKTECLVMDFARNIETHGPVDLADPHKPIKTEGVGEAPVKECPDCEAYVHAAVRSCPHCGHEFPAPEPKVTRFAADAAILSDQRRADWFDVDEWGVDRHEKVGGVPSMRVDYHCGMTRHRQWVFFEHTGGARAKAGMWWRRHGGSDPVPETVDEALERASELVRPEQIYVRPNGKYTEVVATRTMPVREGGEVVGMAPHVGEFDDIPF